MRAAVLSLVLSLFASAGALHAKSKKTADFSALAGKFSGSCTMSIILASASSSTPLTIPLAGPMTSNVKVKSKGKKASATLVGSLLPVGVSSGTPVAVILELELQAKKIKITRIEFLGSALLPSALVGKLKPKKDGAKFNGTSLITLVPLNGLPFNATTNVSFDGTVKVKKNKATDTFNMLIPQTGLSDLSMAVQCVYTGKSKTKKK